MRYLDRVLNGEATPLEWLTTNLADARSLFAQVGYLDRAGVELIAAPLRDLLERGGEVHIIVDSRNGLPRHGDLAWLLDLFSPYGERATVRLARDAMPMHSKVFTIRAGDDSLKAMVGSANLTRAGLVSNWETCVAFDSNEDRHVLAAVHSAAMAWRAHPAVVKVDVGVLQSLVPASPTGRSQIFADGLIDAFDQIESAGNGKPVGILTGFQDVDRIVGGLRDGELVLIAGRPSMGKSTLAVDILRTTTIRHGLPAALLSFEMSQKEITTRILAAESQVELPALRSGLLSEEEWADLAKAMAKVAEIPLFINDQCNPSIRHVAAEVRRLVADDGARLVVVDYVQQLNADRRVESRQHEIAEVSRALKHLAREIQVPIIVVCQLSRASELRPDKRPILSDLRDSGGLEQDADIVILVHRDDYYDKESPRAGEADLIIAKHRNGPTDTVTVAAQLHLSRFVDMAIF